MAGAQDIVRLRRVLFIRLPIWLGALLAIWLAAAGDAGYWQAWMVSATFLGLVLAVGTFFIRTDPDFLLHRLQFREKEAAQKKVVRIWSLLFLVALVLPGLDVRFGWSTVPAWLCLVGLALMVAAYVFVIWVFRTNRYASRIVEIQAGQTVISSGPYAVVRHPMYAAQLVLFPAWMLALGSWWGAALVVWIVLPLVLRIRNEEDVLRQDLPGYAEYCGRIHYRLIPGIW
jgi:protein-S-isoprenylcysteine O-methyltransferase Ste14